MKLYKMAVIIASTFSVLFSLAFIKELHRFTQSYVFIFTSLFLTLFVIYIEISKVVELRKYYRGRNYSKFAIIGTFSISFLSSLLGLYFWTNETQLESIDLNNDLKSKELHIEQLYQRKIDSINSIPVSSPEYQAALTDLSFWKARKAYDMNQRSEILSNIRNLEEKRTELYNTLTSLRNVEISRLLDVKTKELELVSTQFNGQHKNMNRTNLISFIFLIMVVITELIIINVQRQIINFYNPEQRMIINIVKDCELRNLEALDINEFKFNHFNVNSVAFKEKTNTEKDWIECKKTFNLLYELRIIDRETNQIICKNPSKFLVKYFNQINNL